WRIGGSGYTTREPAARAARVPCGIVSALAAGSRLNEMGMATETSITLTLDDRDEAVMLFGSRDQNLRLIRDALGVRLVARGDLVHIDGNDVQVDQADRVFQQLRGMLKQHGKLSPE